MRIHLASHLFVPRPQGVFCHDLAQNWVRQGHEVVVFTADPGTGTLGNGYRLVSGLPMSYDRSSLSHRLISRLVFGAAATAASADDARTHGQPDVFVSAGVLPAVWRSITRRAHWGANRRTPFVVWLFDLWPDILQAHRPDSRLVRWANTPLSSALGQVLKAADAVVTISPAMRDIVARRTPTARVEAIPLWASNEERAQDGVANPAVPRKARSPFVAAYHGNLGLSYDFDPILKAARAFRSDEVQFLIVGDGPRRSEIARQIATDDLKNVELRPPLPAAEFWESLAATDVHLLPLRDTWDVVSFPSKILPYLASARPIVVLGSEKGEAAKLIRDARCGITAPATAEGLERALRTLQSNEQQRLEMAAAGTALYKTTFSAHRAFEGWTHLLSRMQPDQVA